MNPPPYKPEIWVDFNDVDSDDRVTTLQKFCLYPLAWGMEVIAFDGDGNRRDAIVMNLKGGLIRLALRPEVRDETGECDACDETATGDALAWAVAHTVRTGHRAHAAGVNLKRASDEV